MRGQSTSVPYYADEMNITYEVTNEERRFSQILKLQAENLVSALSLEEQRRQGFVFTVHTLALLKKMSEYLPQIVGLDDADNVIGYTLAMPVEMKLEIPQLEPLFPMLERIEYKGKALSDYQFWVGGQVCVDACARGKGVLGELYRNARMHIPERYRMCVTEIASDNRNSLRAHHKLGFETVRSYPHGGREWQIVVWDIPKT
jgi:GNAT superfamily N-acetyltransferase